MLEGRRLNLENILTLAQEPVHIMGVSLKLAGLRGFRLCRSNSSGLWGASLK